MRKVRGKKKVFGAVPDSQNISLLLAENSASNNQENFNINKLFVQVKALQEAPMESLIDREYGLLMPDCKQTVPVPDYQESDPTLDIKGVASKLSIPAMLRSIEDGGLLDATHCADSYTEIRPLGVTELLRHAEAMSEDVKVHQPSHGYDLQSLMTYAKGLPNEVDATTLPQAPENGEKCFNIGALLQSADKKRRESPRTLRDSEGVFQNQTAAKAMSQVAEDLSKILRFMVYRNSLYIWTENRWSAPTMIEFIRIVREKLPREEILISFSTKNYEELYKKILTDPRLQIHDYELQRHDYLIACSDGIYDTADDCIGESLPEHFIFSYSNISIHDIGQGHGQIFERFLDNCTNGDTAVRQRILEVIGVILSGYMVKSFFLLIGPKNTRKTQFMQLLMDLVGTENTASIQSLNDFADRWTTGDIRGKKLCVCPDVPKVGVNASALAIMKQLVGGDLVAGEQKFEKKFFYINDAKLLFASNHPIKVDGAQSEDAFLDRIIYVPFRNSIPKEKMIPEISKLLIREKGYIVGKAIEALQGLRSRNFVFTRIAEETYFEDTGVTGNGIIEFCHEKCVFVENEEIATADLHKAYCEYCSDRGLIAFAIEAFARTLKENFPELNKTRRVNGEAKRGFSGVRLKNEEERNHEK